MRVLNPSCECLYPVPTRSSVVRTPRDGSSTPCKSSHPFPEVFTTTGHDSLSKTRVESCRRREVSESGLRHTHTETETVLLRRNVVEESRPSCTKTVKRRRQVRLRTYMMSPTSLVRSSLDTCSKSPWLRRLSTRRGTLRPR